MPGFASGTMMRQNVCHGFAPSMRAASSSSAGIDMKNCRMRNVPNALKRPGTMSACSVFSQPRFWMISYCGSR